tara:strand:+ start:8597 stop:9484 length:888 start_codon:yes stop_codon:yes gene_type:complete
MNTEKKISIVMNCYNGESFLKLALESIFNQTYQNWELIFWDNKSQDNSKKILDNYTDNRVRYFISDNHTSQYEARKRAVENCSGELIAFLDVDDWWDISKLEKQSLLFDDPEVGFACCNYWIINERKGIKKTIAFKNIPTGYITEQLLIRNFVGMSTLMVRRDSYFALKYGFNPEFEIIGDYDLILRLSQNYKLSCTKEPLSFYRWHGNNLGFLKFELNIYELEKWIENANSFKKYKNFNYLINYTSFYSGLIDVQNNKRFKALIKLIKIKSIYFRLKLFLVILMPLWLIKMIRS